MKADIEVIIKDESGIGYGYICESDGYYLGTVYQSRFNKELLKEKARDELLIDEIAQSKAFSMTNPSNLKILNLILDFYFIEGIKEIPDLNKHKSIASAINHLENNSLKYYIFTL